MTQSAEAQPVGRHVGPLALAHQPGDIDAGRAFQPAAVAVDAQVGHVLELVAGQAAQVEPAGEHAADQVGLRPRRRLLGRREAEDRAHPHVRRPASGTRRSGCRRPSRRPPAPGPSSIAARPGREAAATRLRLRGRRRLRRPAAIGRTEVARQQLRVVADDLARVEDVLRVEDLLHLAEHVVERPDLPARGRACGSARRRVRR